MNISHFLRGHLQVSVTAPFPQRLLNLSAQENILFWALDWENPSKLKLNIPFSQYRPLCRLAKQVGAEVEIQNRFGLPALAGRFRHRIGFLFGFALSLFTVCFLSQFILVVEMQGNDKVDSATLRTALEKAGLHVGAYGPALSTSQLAQMVLADVDGISWMSINLFGTRAQVIVQETIDPPVIFPTEGVYDIIATTGGIIEEIQVHKGQAVVAVGDTVAHGQLLIRGMVELPLPLYSQEEPEWLPVPSSGKIVARTWRKLTAVIPLEVLVKEETAMANNAFELSLFGEKWTFFENNLTFSQNYDKIRHTQSLPPLKDLPLSFTHISQTPFRLVPATLNTSSATSLLQHSLQEELGQILGETGEILDTSFETREENGLLLVTLEAECREEIGLTVEGLS